MADDGLTFEAWTMPHVGAQSKKFNFTKYINSFVLNDRFNDLTDGVLSLADDFPLKDELFKIDEADHANDVGSMVRVLRGSTPIMHYLVTRMEDSWSDEQPTQKATLEGLEWLLDRATVPHQDHPRDPTVEPDWIYGADSLLFNTGLEESGLTSTSFQLTITATAGTFTITVGSFGNTAAINFNVDAVNLALAIEAVAGINDVLVTGDGSDTNPFVVEFLDPAETDIGTIIVDDTGLTGDAFFFQLSVGGASVTDPWTVSRVPVNGVIHGTYNFFRVSTDQAHSGTKSLFVDADLGDWPSSYPGAQQVVSVTPGRTYRAEVWVYPLFNARYRFGIRTVDETWLATTEADLTANSWQQMTLSVTIPDHVRQVIFRIACISFVHGVQKFYVDDAVLAPGFPAATLGKIMGDIRTAALAVGSPLSWLTPTWDDNLDSDAVAWDRDLKWSVTHDQTFLQLLEYVRRWNYEWRIRWNNAQSRFDWDMWNPLGGGQTRSNIAITGKSGVSSSGPIVSRPPEFTYHRVEGERGRWGEYASTTLDDVWGRLEKAGSDRHGVASEELDVLAQRLVERGQDKTAARSVQLEDPAILPWQAYEPGDTVYLNLAPKDTRRQLRIAGIAVTMDGNRATPLYEVHFVTPVLSAEAGLVQGVRELIRELRAQRPTTTDGRPVSVGVVTGGRMNSFSLPGQAFVEVGRLRLQWPFRVVIQGISLACNVAPTGASIIFDAHRNGILGVGPAVTIFTAEGQRPSIADGAKGGLEAIPAVPLLEPYEQLTVDCDQVGSILPGGDVTVMVRWAEVTELTEI